MNTRTATELTPTLYNISKETMTSLEIAEITGKNHSHIMRDIRNLLSQGVSESNFGLSSYKQAQPNGGTKNVPCYELTKKGCLILASGYDALLRERIINRWEELEKEKRNGGFIVPQSFSEALMLAAKQQMQIEDMQRNIEARKAEEQRLLIENAQKDETINEQGEQIIKLSNDIVKMQPKVDYCDKILSSTSLVTTTQIAQDYGYSAVAFNKILAELRIQHKVNKQWILYAPYLACGYVDSVPVDINKSDGTVKVVFHTEWTQKGRLFLYEKLKSHNIVPLIEK